MGHYIAYYDSQVGGGIDQVFVGSPYQRGNGIGSFLSGLFRKALPILSSGAKTVGKEALRAGVGILSDLSQSMPFGESVRSRSRNATSNLKNKIDAKMDSMMMSGSGYKRLPGIASSQFKNKRQRKRTAGRKKKKKRSAKSKVRRVIQKKKKKKVKKRKTAAATRKKKSQKRKVTDIFGPA